MAQTSDTEEVPFGATAIRLSPTQWLFVGLIFGGALFMVPPILSQLRPLESPRRGYRIPYELSEDYWHFSRRLREVTDHGLIPAIGDSVIWGEYVLPGDSLSGRLNQMGGQRFFANCGLNGLHPIALEGLVHYFGDGLPGRKVLVHCNLLWLSSAERDLQVGDENTFNHPELVPQFYPKIPAYSATTSERLAVAVDRMVPLRQWARHMQLAFFNRQALTAWSLEHPYENPLPRLAKELPQPETRLRHRPIAWHQGGIPKQDMPWVKLDSSLQWQAFQRTIRKLRKEQAIPFVLVGPFNKHLLVKSSRIRLQKLHDRAVEWLRSESIAHYAPDALSSDDYGDASHPLAAGYGRLASQLWNDPSFQDWL